MRLLICLFLLVPGWVGAQKFTTLNTTKEKALKAYNDGQKESNAGEFAIAQGYYERALKEDPLFIDAHLSLAETFIDLRDFFKAEKSFKDAIALDSTARPTAFLRLAKVEWQLDKYAESAAAAASYLRSNPPAGKLKSGAQFLLSCAQFAANAVAHPVPFDPKPVGPGVNTDDEEYFPCLTADGETMVFTRREGTFPMEDENFYLSHKVNGIWEKAEPMEDINTAEREGAQSISPDGTWLVFTACNRTNDGSQGSCDLYWSQEKAKGWTAPKPFSATINSADWDSQPSISADGKSIVFCSRRPGGRGQEDLWITTRGAGGKWSKPENLGPTINTGGVDQTPFLHFDGQTLYFSSDSLPGMGGKDLFMVRRNPDGSWGKPENLGYPINTKADEIALFVTLDGKTAYYATDKAVPGSKKRSLDIYSFDLPESARPRPVTYARVQVKDAATGNQVSAKAEFIDLKTGQVYVSANTRADGTALACLPAGRDYALNVVKEKYFFYSENFNLLETATLEKPFLLEVALLPVPDSLQAPVAGRPGAKPQPVVLRNVFFETGSAALLPASTAELDRLVAMLKQVSYLKIQVNGHTDDVGKDTDNLALSEARAKSVYDYLVGKGIAAERLQYKGFGETAPIDTNDTPEGRGRNRRTEFVVF